MSEDRPKKQRPSAGGRGGRPSNADRGASSRAGRTGGSGRAGQGGRDQGGRDQAGRDSGAPRRGGKPGSKRSGSPAGRTGDRRGPRPDRRTDRRTDGARTSDQRAYDGPDLPDDITGKELDRSVAAQLKGLPEKLAARVARHLAAAGMFIESDPELAYQHAKAAKSRAARIAVVREAAGEAAYAAGHYAEALADLRAAKRMNGATAYLPIMADCHRALGQPEQALKLAGSPSVGGFPPEAKAEMTIVAAGARRDMKQYDAALRTLEQAPLMSRARASWVVRLRYAYADTLAEAGRTADALTWFHRTHAIDSDELTDAATRAEELEKVLGDSRPD